MSMMGLVTNKLTAWSQEPANAQTINGLQGGQDFFNWLNNEQSPLLNKIVTDNSTFGIPSEAGIKRDLETIMDTAKRNGNNAEGLRQAYEADPSGFMTAVKFNNQSDLDQRIQRARAAAPAVDTHATLEDAEQKVSSVIEDPEHTDGQQLTGAVLLESLQSVMAGDMKIEDLFQVFVDFISQIAGTKFDSIGQELGGIGQKLGLKPPEPAPAPAAPAPTTAPTVQPQAAPDPALAGPGI